MYTNQVTLRRAGLVLRWVTVQTNRLGIFNQTSTQGRLSLAIPVWTGTMTVATVTGHFGHKTLRHQNTSDPHETLRHQIDEKSGHFGPRTIPTRHSYTGDSAERWCRNVLWPKCPAPVAAARGDNKLSCCWETVLRESMPRIAEMDVEMTT